jgi:PTS system cellobiose-specific IIA component
MNAITFRDLAGEMVDLYEKLYASGSLKTES